MATIVGGGVLSLPLAFEKCGIVGATILMVFAATITAKSLDLLCSTARKTGATSFGGVGKDAFGAWMDTSISVLLFVFLLFVLVAYMVLLRDIWTPLVQLQLPGISGDVVLLGIIILMSPCLVQRTLHALRFNCYIGFGSVSLLCIALLHHAVMTLMTTATAGGTTDDQDVRTTNATSSLKLKYFPDSLADALFAFPIITLSFLSAFNILPIQNALIKPTMERMQLVVNFAVASCFVLMYCFGLGGYLYAKEETRGNILLNCNNYKEDWMFLLGRVGCGTTIMLALGMMMLPCRDSLLEVLDLLIVTRLAALSRSASLPCGENTSLLGNHTTLPQRVSLQDNPVVHYITTFGIALTTYLGAVVAPGVAIVWSLCGSSMAFVISFLLPAACYLQLERQIPDSADDGRRTKQLFSWFLGVFSVVGAVLCTRQTVMMMDSTTSVHQLE